MTHDCKRPNVAAVRTVTESELQRALEALPILEPRLVASGNLATPSQLLASADRALSRYRLFMLNAQAPLPMREGVTFETPFVGPGMRYAGDALDYLPMRLSLVPRLFAGMRPPDIVLLHASPPHQRGGTISLGIEVNVLVTAVERTRARGGLVVAQLNPKMPYTHGDGELRQELVDLAIEVDQPLPNPVLKPSHQHAELIGETVAGLVQDGSTLQLGIGQAPEATLRALAGRRGLSIWSEMISDGVMDLDRRGAIDSGRPICCSFMFGSEELYSWVHRNPSIRLLRTETINDPTRIASRPAMVSINTALQLDLFDQAGASHIDGHVYSGFGGQPDFVTGAMRSPGGQAIIALRSWHQGSESSTIVPLLCSPATSFQHSAIVTEHGCAELLGRSQRAQARLIVERAAHPDVREELMEHASLFENRERMA